MAWYMDFGKKNSSTNYQAATIIERAPNVIEDSNFENPPSVSCSSSPHPEAATNTTDEERCNTTPSTRKRKKNASDLDKEINKVDALIASTLEKRTNEDEPHHYGMSVAARLRRLSVYQQGMARRDIEAALFKAEFETPALPIVSESTTQPMSFTTLLNM